MEIDDLEHKIKTDIDTATKNVCSKTKAKNTKLKPATRELMKERRNMKQDATNYAEIKKGVKKIREEHKKPQPPDLIKKVIENNINIIVLRSRNSTGKQQSTK